MKRLRGKEMSGGRPVWMRQEGIAGAGNSAAAGRRYVLRAAHSHAHQRSLAAGRPVCVHVPGGGDLAEDGVV